MKLLRAVIKCNKVTIIDSDGTIIHHGRFDDPVMNTVCGNCGKEIYNGFALVKKESLSNEFTNSWNERSWKNSSGITFFCSKICYKTFKLKE